MLPGEWKNRFMLDILRVIILAHIVSQSACEIAIIIVLILHTKDIWSHNLITNPLMIKSGAELIGPQLF